MVGAVIWSGMVHLKPSASGTPDNSRFVKLRAPGPCVFGFWTLIQRHWLTIDDSHDSRLRFDFTTTDTSHVQILNLVTSALAPDSYMPTKFPSSVESFNNFRFKDTVGSP